MTCNEIVNQNPSDNSENEQIPEDEASNDSADNSDDSDVDDSSDEDEEAVAAEDFLVVKEEETKAPPTITLQDTVPTALDFHPKQNLLVVGTLAGDAHLYRYAEEEEGVVERSWRHHTECCRSARFTHDGLQLLTIGSDKRLSHIDVSTGQSIHNFDNAHDVEINRVCVVDEYLAVTGDDSGVVKIWDYRATKRCTHTFRDCDDTINDLCMDAAKKTLLTASGDGALTVYDVRAKRLQHQSELFDYDTMSVAIVRQGSKVLVGSGDGAISIFNWDEWGHMYDRITGKQSVDCMVPVTDAIVIYGCEDGTIRAANINPNEQIGIVGRHDKFPLEALRICRQSKYAATCSHDSAVKFFRVDFLERHRPNHHRKRNTAGRNLVQGTSSSFFAGLVDDGES